MLNASEEPIDRLPAEAFSGDLEVPKGAFSELLYRHTCGAADFLFDETITGLYQDDEGVLVSFERESDRRFDLVLGADGAYSRVRRLTFGPHDTAVRHLGVSGGGFSIDNDLGLDHEGVLLAQPGSTIYLFSGQDADRLTVSLSFATASADLDRQGREPQETALRNAFAGSGWEAPRLLAQMSGADDFYFASAGQVQLDRWSDGRIALLGDAGYCAAPTSGMGTSQALIGARSLSRRLAAVDGDHAAAFAAYEAELRPYVADNQAIGRAGVEAFGGAAVSEIG